MSAACDAAQLIWAAGPGQREPSRAWGADPTPAQRRPPATPLGVGPQCLTEALRRRQRGASVTLRVAAMVEGLGGSSVRGMNWWNACREQHRRGSRVLLMR